MREMMQAHRERGQTLVIVALALTTLMLMVGLVTDIGVAYNRRRDMQNAADAAALAGAWKFCDQNKADVATQTLARNEAIRVAQTVNGSNPADTVVVTGNYTVSVTTGVDSPLFFLKLLPLGLDTIPVSAEAEAVCGCANELGGAWPIAFDIDTWDTVDCGESLVIWEGKDELPFAGVDLCDSCICPVGISHLVAFGATGLPGLPANRGWLSLSYPPEDSCGGGSAALDGWMLNDYPGAIVEGNCVITETGNKTTLVDSAKTRMGTDPYVSIVIFDPSLNHTCTEAMVTTGQVGCGEPLYVVGTGCVKVVGTYKNTFQLSDKPGVTPNCPREVSDKKSRVILATRMCDDPLCPVSGIGSAGGQPAQGCILAASLVK